MTSTKSILSCTEGGIHDLVYLGRVKKQYRCNKCGTVLDKAKMAAETN